MKKLVLLVLPIILMSACNSSPTEQSVTTNSNVAATTKNTSKILTGDLIVGKEADLIPGIYDLKAVGNGHGTISVLISDGKDMPFRRYMASTTGKDAVKKIGSEAGIPEKYSENVQGLILREGYTININNISLEFTRVNSSSTTKILTSNLTVGEDSDLLPGTYNLLAVGDGHGTISVSTSDGKKLSFHKYMASITGKEIIKQIGSEAGSPESYNENIQGLVLHDGDSINIGHVSIEFTKIE